MTKNIIVGGIEGGGTHSVLALVDLNGNVLATVYGSNTNHWTIGMVECQRRIMEMVKEAKAQAGIPDRQPLDALGLCLSGCEQEESNIRLAEGMKLNYPHVAERYVVHSDTDGSVASVSRSGGIVMISGTGSNCLLINPDGTRYQCGGWGHMLGDEGSAYWISQRAIKAVFDDHDGLEIPAYSTEWIWNLMKSHFNLESRTDLLDHMYTHFEKHNIAALCRKLADGAREGDKMCVKLFEDAGKVLAKTLLAQVPRANNELKDKQGGLQVLCVGSVWKSWDLLKPGFIPLLKQCPHLQELSLTRLKCSSAMGAVYLAADKYNFKIPRNYEENHHVFYHYQK